jgi:hypothetical protein
VQFRLPTARQQGENRLTRRQTKQSARRHATVFEWQHVGQRMADVTHRDSLSLVEGSLAGKERQHAGDRGADLVDAPAAPGPDRRTDVMDRRYSPPLERLLQGQIEIRRVHTDKDVGWIGQQAALQVAPNTRDLAEMFEHFDVAADGQLLERIPGIEAQGKHFRPTHTAKDRLRKPCLHGLHQLAGEQIARRLAGNHGDAHGGRAHRMMPRFETARKSTNGWISGWATTSCPSLVRASSSIRPDL